MDTLFESLRGVLTILLILVMLIPFIRGVFKEARAAA